MADAASKSWKDFLKRRMTPDGCAKLLEQAAQQQRAPAAIERYEKLLADIKGRGQWEDPDLQPYIGQAFLALGRLTAPTDPDAAAGHYLEARSRVTLDAPAVQLLSLALARKGDASTEAIALYLEYLGAKPDAAERQPVLTVLESAFRITEETAPDTVTNDLLQQNYQLARLVPELDWPYVYLGIGFWLKGRGADARRCLEIAVRVNPQHAAAAHVLGLVCEQAGDMPAAVGFLRMAAGIQGSKPEAAYRLGRLLLQALQGELADVRCEPAQKGQWAREALSLLQRAEGMDPQPADYHLYRGLARYLTSDLAGAAQALASAAETASGLKEVWYWRAEVGLAQGEKERAEGWLAQALDLDPGYLRANARMGDLLFERREFARAREHYRSAPTGRCVEHTGGGALEPQQKRNLGLACIEVKEHAEAAAALAAVLEAFPEVLLPLVGAYVASGQFGEAIACLRARLEHQPQDAELWHHLGCVHGSAGHNEDAFRALERARSLRPGHAATHLMLGNASLDRGDIESARAHYRKAGECDPRDPRAPYGLACCAWREEDEDDALRLLQEAHRLDPDFAPAAFRLGVLHAQRENWRAAVTCFTKARDWGRVGIACCRSGLYRRAQDAFEQAQAAGAVDDAAVYHWGYALAQLGEEEAALARWEELLQRQPEDPELRRDLQCLGLRVAERHLAEGRLQEAAAALQKCEDAGGSSPAIPDALAKTWFRVGQRLLAEGRDARAALQPLRWAYHHLPDDAEHAYWMALCWMVNGEAVQARDVLRDLAAREGADAGYRYAYGLALAQTGDSEGAEEQFRAAQVGDGRLQGLDERLRWVMAWCHARRGRWDEAGRLLAGAGGGS